MTGGTWPKGGTFFRDGTRLEPAQIPAQYAEEYVFLLKAERGSCW